MAMIIAMVFRAEEASATLHRTVLMLLKLLLLGSPPDEPLQSLVGEKKCELK